MSFGVTTFSASMALPALEAPVALPKSDDGVPFGHLSADLKEGDHVLCTASDWRHHTVGDVYIVNHNNTIVDNDGDETPDWWVDWSVRFKKLCPVDPAPSPVATLTLLPVTVDGVLPFGELSSDEKKELMGAWVDGETIQVYRTSTSNWVKEQYPIFAADVYYRVKPVDPRLTMLAELKDKLESLIETRNYIDDQLKPLNVKDSYTPWKDMSDVDKGLILLAAREGKTVQVATSWGVEWFQVEVPSFTELTGYRVAPDAAAELYKARNEIQAEILDTAEKISDLEEELGLDW